MRQIIAGLLLALAAAPGLAAQEASGGPGTRVVLLGTGTPIANPARSGPAVALVVRGSVYLVDAGHGIVLRAEEARRHGVAELTQPNLKIVFLTHLHSDHTLGLADLIFAPWVGGRSAPLEVYGPAGTAAMTSHLVAAYEEDIRIRSEGLEGESRAACCANAHEIQPGLVYQDSNVRVTAFLVEHGSIAQSYGYRFDTADRSIVISGDTRASEAIVTACDGCDVLVHEAYDSAALARREPRWQRYHASFHTSAPDLARIALRARPGLLVLYHQLLWGSSPEDLLAEIRRAGYPGRVVSGNDLDIY